MVLRGTRDGLSFVLGFSRRCSCNSSSLFEFVYFPSHEVTVGLSLSQVLTIVETLPQDDGVGLSEQFRNHIRSEWCTARWNSASP
jgi:hypothetical protein